MNPLKTNTQKCSLESHLHFLNNEFILPDESNVFTCLVKNLLYSSRMGQESMRYLSVRCARVKPCLQFSKGPKIQRVFLIHEALTITVLHGGRTIVLILYNTWGI